MTKLKLLELFDNLKVIVSDDGKIHTINHTNTRCNGRCDNRKGKVLKPSIDKDGYEKVVLTKTVNEKHTVFIDWLLWLSYLIHTVKKNSESY